MRGSILAVLILVSLASPAAAALPLPTLGDTALPAGLPAGPWTPVTDPATSPGGSLGLPLSGLGLPGLHVVARAGGREQVAPVNPLTPTAIGFDTPSRVDLLVSVSPGGLPAVGFLAGSGTVTLEARPLRPLENVEVYLVSTGEAGAMTALGFGVPRLPSPLALTLDLRDSAVAVLAGDARAGNVTVALHQTAPGETLDLRASLSPAPANARIAFDLREGVALAYEASAPSALTLTLDEETPNATSRVHGTWTDLPQRFTLTGATGAGPGSWTYRASGPSGPLTVLATEERGDGARWGRVEASGLPREAAAVSEERGDGFALAYTASERVSRLLVEGGVSDTHARLDVTSVPAAFTLSHSSLLPFAFSAADPLGALAFAAGTGGAPCPSHEGDFLGYARGEGSTACAAGRITGLRTAAVEAAPDGSTALSLAAGGAEALTLLAEDAAGPHGSLRITPVPATLRLGYAPVPDGARLTFEASERVRVTGAFSTALEATTAAPEDTLRFTSAEHAALAFDIRDAPLALVLTSTEATPTPGGAGSGGETNAFTLELGLAGLPERLALTLAGVGDSRLLHWDGSGAMPGLTAEAFLDGASPTRVAATVMPFPETGTLVVTGSSLAYRFPEHVALALRAAAGAQDPVLPPIPGPGALEVTAIGDEVTLALHVPRLPLEGSISWRDGFALGYTGGAPNERLRVAALLHDLEASFDLPLGETLAFSTTSRTPGELMLKWAMPAPIPVLDVALAGPGGATGRISLENLPAQGELALGAPLAAAIPGIPEVRYRGDAPGLTLTAAVDGPLLGLGPGASLHVPEMPREVTLTNAAPALHLEADAPLTASISTGPATWGSSLLRFDTRDVTLALDAVRSLTLRPGLLGVDVAGEGGGLRVAHSPTGASGNVVLLVEGADGWTATPNALDLPFGGTGRETYTVYYGQNVHAMLNAVTAPVSGGLLIAAALAAGVLLLAPAANGAWRR